MIPPLPKSLPEIELAALFQNPGPAWRGKPFWSWNGRLDKDELLRQVDVMKTMGFGGDVEFCARPDTMSVVPVYHAETGVITA